MKVIFPRFFKPCTRYLLATCITYQNSKLLLYPELELCRKEKKKTFLQKLFLVLLSNKKDFKRLNSIYSIILWIYNGYTKESILNNFHLQLEWFLKLRKSGRFFT